MISRSIIISNATATASQPVPDPVFESRLAVWNRSSLKLELDATHFGYVAAGTASLDSERGTFTLRAGMYFAIPGSAEIRGDGIGFVASRVGWHGFFHLGGPAEQYGRLRYIDGCSDSLLISPVQLGDPCLNLLHLPPGTTQTQHTHPSCRIGMIAGGRGICRTPDADYPLETGMVFTIAADALHSFHTQEESLRVIAWHPDSDTGPTHQNHPMINRTIIDGISAADRLQTQSILEESRR